MRLKVAILFGILLFVALTVPAQLQDPISNAKASPQDSSPQPHPASNTKKPKKVWTNDQLPKTGGGVSVVGDPAAPGSDTRKAPDAANPKDEARQQRINQYKKQLAKLQSQINAADKRIDQLKNFKGENTKPSDGIDINQGYNMVPIPDQIKELEDKKKELRAKMDDIETEAHKNGITADNLR